MHAMMRTAPPQADIMIPGRSTSEQYRAVCLRVVRDAQVARDRPKLEQPARLAGGLPQPAGLRPPEMREFEAAMRVAFDQVVHESPVFERRRRGANATEELLADLSRERAALSRA